MFATRSRLLILPSEALAPERQVFEGGLLLETNLVFTLTE